MKPDTLNTIVMARILFDNAHQSCMVDDKHVASAGLVMLQDAVELLLYACLIEKGTDEQRNLERLSFDELISELKKTGVRVAKSGTLKAMNKQRVIVKHYGQLAEPTTVRHYFAVSKTIVDDLLQQVVGKSLYQIVLYDIVKNDEVRECLSAAGKAIEAGNHFEALVEVRKAIFLEVEEDYSIVEWKDTPSNSPNAVLLGLSKGGFKALWWNKNKEWIQENVKDPFDYIQLDHERMRLDLLEWGVGTQDFWNLWRLTPSVFRESKQGEWLIKGDIPHLLNAATEQNARYCLDRACSLILKKQSHSDLSRQLSYVRYDRLMVKLKINQPLYEKASSNSKITDTLHAGNSYSVRGFVPGLSENKKFANILHIDTDDPKKAYVGYVVYDDSTCQLIDMEKEGNESPE